MKEHLVFLTENGDCIGLSARLASYSRDNSPGKSKHSWLNTEGGLRGILRGRLKWLKRRDLRAPSTLWHMRLHENLSPKGRYAAKWSEVSVKHAVIRGSDFVSCPTSHMTKPFNCCRWWRGDFLPMPGQRHAPLDWPTLYRIVITNPWMCDWRFSPGLG